MTVGYQVSKEGRVACKTGADMTKDKDRDSVRPAGYSKLLCNSTDGIPGWGRNGEATRIEAVGV